MVAVAQPAMAAMSVMGRFWCSYRSRSRAGLRVLARATLAGLLIAGSVYAYLVSLPWPEHPAPPPAAPSAPSPQAMLGYGVRLGAAAAAAAAIGFAFHFDHVGWACAAVLLVMRPS